MNTKIKTISKKKEKKINKEEILKELKELEEDVIEGYDIDIDDLNRQRIDKLVNNYEEMILRHVEEEYVKATKKSDQIADKIASFGGSWNFIGYMACFLAFWILWNILPFTPFHFDSAPFILLNLLLSFTAAFQAPIIIMSQNRQAARDKQESIIDFAINYKAEQEIDSIQSHLYYLEAEIKELKQLLIAHNSIK